jgi:hypothetical protein
MPNIPNTNQNGQILVSTGDGQNSSKWGGATFPTVNRTYVITGAIGLPSGATNYIPPFPYVLLNGETVYLVGIQAAVRTGTVTLQINQNGTGIAGLTSVSVTSTSTYFTPTNPALVTSGDLFAPVVTAIGSTPDGMFVDFVFSVTL